MTKFLWMPNFHKERWSLPKPLQRFPPKVQQSMQCHWVSWHGWPLKTPKFCPEKTWIPLDWGSGWNGVAGDAPRFASVSFATLPGLWSKLSGSLFGSPWWHNPCQWQRCSWNQWLLRFCWIFGCRRQNWISRSRIKNRFLQRTRMDKFPIIFICHPYLHANVYDGSNYALNDMVYAYHTKNRTNDTFHHKLNMLVALCPDLAEGPTTLLSLLAPPPVDPEEVGGE